MRRRAVIAGWGLWLGLSLAVQGGCAWLSPRGREDRPPPTPQQIQRIQQISERAQAAIELDPRRHRAHFSMGRVLEAVGRTDEALAAYFRALEFDPNDAEVSLRIAAIQLARDQPDQALARLDQVVELARDDGEACE